MKEGPMRAVQQEMWGGPEVLRMVTVPHPRPLPTEVLVRVKAAGLNPVDRFTREGQAYMSAINLPFIPGWDVAGVVEEVGYGVTRFQPGDEVYGMPHFPRAASAYAEFVAAPSRHLAHKPAGISFAEAAALPLCGLTAWQMLVDVAAVRPGQRVLINAAAGGVGHLAVQIAKARGARVIGTARAAKHAFVRGLGADEMVDYTATDVAEVIRDVDIVIELVGGETCLRMLRTLRPGGLLVSAQAAWAPTLQQEADELGVRASAYLVEPDHAGLAALTNLVEQGLLKIHVDEEFPLHQAAKAQEVLGAGRTIGKLVLTP